MKAIVWTAYGSPDVLQLKEVEKPNPKDNEVLVKIFATTVTAGDSELRSLKFPIYLSLPMRIWVGLSKPSRKPIPGTELAGEIVSVGKDVALFSEGDQVFGSSGLNFGANAEYICLPEGAVAAKPSNMTYEEAAAVPFGGRDALHFLRKGNVRSGQKILINGAGGSIGTFAVQLAKVLGAEVTAVDSGEKLEMLRSIGADQVIDYTEEDFIKNGEIYDVIFDVIGKVSLSGSRNSMRENGTYLLANPGMSQLLGGLWTSMTSSTNVVMQAADPTADDLVFLRDLIEAGKIETVIDRRYPLEQLPDAHRYVDTGRKQGNVVITVKHDSRT
jgi:2-desacetyl-2-hydroxyethyl bacteriochlorophyllide A dehydrogenase